MRRKNLFTLLAVIMSCAGLWSQNFAGFALHARVEISFDMFNLRQNGNIYIREAGHDPSLYYEPKSIDQSTSCPGLGVRLWYALNFGTASFEKIGLGVETGLNLNDGRAKLSVVSQPDAKGLNLRFPLLLSARYGACVDRRYYGKFGWCFAGGMEIIRTSIPNETGIYVLPKVEGMINVKKINFFVGVYLSPIESHYILNGVRTVRQKTSFYDFGVRFGITQYAPKYRSRGKLELLK